MHLLSPPSPRIRPARPAFQLLFALLCWSGVPAMAAPPVVAVSPISRGDGFREVSFDAELRPYREVEVHAKVTGYLDALKVDIGDSVKEGQLIASLDIPETKIELEHAMAGQRRSNAEVDRASAAYD